MAWRKSSLHIAALSLALAMELGATTSSAISVSPQNNRTSGDRVFTQAVPINWHAVEPSPPPGSRSSEQRPGQNWNAFEPPQRGVPGRREGGGTRGGDCKFDPKEVTAIIPKTTMGRTLAANPTFWFYLPAALDKTVEIVLTDEANALPDKLNKQDLYSQRFRLITKTPGVVSVTLPSQDNSPILETGKNYHWVMSIHCDTDDPSADIFVAGWVQRVDATPTLVSELQQASPRDRFNLYAQAGLWYEALTTLAELRSSAPNDTALAQKWGELLKSVELDKIAQQPFVQSQLLPRN
ncbi:MAG: DUF928 domain-containing protein [Actinomycetota bacterium]